MELWKNNVPGLAQTSASVMNGVDSRRPIHRRVKSLTIRTQKIECMLADIQFQIETLRRERAYLELVREELIEMGVPRNGSPLRNTSLKEGGRSCSGESSRINLSNAVRAPFYSPSHRKPPNTGDRWMKEGCR